MVRNIPRGPTRRFRFCRSSSDPHGILSGQRTGRSNIAIIARSGGHLRPATYLSRMIQRWGKIPLLFLEALNLQDHRYAFIGTEDWFMYPLLQPGSFLIIDETQRRISNSGWNNEFDRPIYFFEHRQGYSCGWCHLNVDQLVLQPHPASMCSPEVYTYPQDIDLIGQVSGVA